MTLAEIALPFAERGEAETDALADRHLPPRSRRGASFAALAREYSRSDTAAQRRRARPDARRPGCPPAFRSQVLLLSPGQVTRPMPISGRAGADQARLDLRRRRPEPKAADDPGGARGAAPAALRRADHQLRPGLPAGAARRRPDRRAMTLPVALTLGDPSGIGGEIALKAWAALRGRLGFFLIGDPDHMRRLGDRLGVPVRAIAAPARRPPRCRRPAGARRTRCRARRRPAAPTRRTPPPSSRSSPAASQLVRERRGARALHQPDQQAGADRGRRLRLPRPHRVPRAPLRRAAAGDDAGRARRCGWCRSPSTSRSPRCPRALTPELPRGDAAHHPPRARRRLRPRRAAHRRRRAQPARRRGRRDGPRGDRGDRPGPRPAARRGHAPSPARARPTRCSTRRRAPATTRRSACTTTRR